LRTSLTMLGVVIGVAAVIASFAWRVEDWSGILAIFGIVAIVGGLVLVLRRRDYRIQQRHYGAEFEEEDG